MSPDENTWEPMKHLNCHEKIAAYEMKIASATVDDSKEKSGSPKGSQRNKRAAPKKDESRMKIARGDVINSREKLKTIEGFIFINDVLFVAVEWEKSGKDLVASDDLRRKFPQELLHAMENKLVFDNLLVTHHKRQSDKK